MPKEETATFVEHEATIERGLSTSFVEVGAALAAIRDGRLYQADHTTFEAYCSERWGMSLPRADELIHMATVVAGTSFVQEAERIIDGLAQLVLSAAQAELERRAATNPDDAAGAAPADAPAAQPATRELPQAERGKALIEEIISNYRYDPATGKTTPVYGLRLTLHGLVHYAKEWTTYRARYPGLAAPTPADDACAGYVRRFTRSVIPFAEGRSSEENGFWVTHLTWRRKPKGTRAWWESGNGWKTLLALFRKARAIG